MLIKYVGRKPEKFDHLYGSGTWAAGETKDVAQKVAVKLLEHADLWAPASLIDNWRAIDSPNAPAEGLKPGYIAVLETEYLALLEDRQKLANLMAQEAPVAETTAPAPAAPKPVHTPPKPVHPDEEVAALQALSAEALEVQLAEMSDEEVRAVGNKVGTETLDGRNRGQALRVKVFELLTAEA